MRLLLVRHGETVDNVAGNFAGVTDSALTAHGVLQASRLAAYLVAQHPSPPRCIFTSDLQRASRTASAIRDAYRPSSSSEVSSPEIPFTETPLLRERDFGPLEGTAFRTCKTNPDDVGESSAEVRRRAARFLDEMLLPFAAGMPSADDVCVVVAHGLVLPQVFACLTQRAAGRVTLEAEAAGRPPWWSNTGYLECLLSQEEGLAVHVLGVNCTAHLRDLKRTRGGIGSAAHDDSQKKIGSFFGKKT